VYVTTDRAIDKIKETIAIKEKFIIYVPPNLLK